LRHGVEQQGPLFKNDYCGQGNLQTELGGFHWTLDEETKTPTEGVWGKGCIMGRDGAPSPIK